MKSCRKQTTVSQVIKTATRKLSFSGSPSPLIDARALLCYVLRKPPVHLLAYPDKALSVDACRSFFALVRQRCNGRPIAHLLGEKEFWSLSLSVSPATLIPRPETETLVEVVLDLAPTVDGAILDLGTGTGAIALALASELPQRDFFGVEMYEEAFELAVKNTHKLGIKNIQLFRGDWFEPVELGTKLAFIVSNPPYIDKCDPHLTKGDVCFEPSSALIAGEDGLASIVHISETARAYLKPGGWLVFENGYQQGEAARNILSNFGYEGIETRKDYTGNDRVTLGRLPG